MREMSYDVVVIGGGSAGMAAACAVAESSAASVLVVEREEYLGGVLPQCVHDGFGLYVYGESLTGPEYAHRWQRRLEAAGVDVALATTVLQLRRDAQAGFAVDAIGQALGGRVLMHAASVVCATGCRERSRGAMQIPGTRPAGVFTAGTAQYMVNVADQLPGDKVVILGSGDIGLIMARRMTLEGAEVRMVLGQEATGLLRNHVQCIQDFHIPIRYGWGLAKVHGRGQLKGVTIAPMDASGRLDLSRHEYIRCNVLLIACGLIPEREVLQGLEDDGELPGERQGLFACGNANVPHDLVDQVSQEGVQVGQRVVDYLARAGVLSAAQARELPDDLARLAARHISEPSGRMSEVGQEAPVGAQRLVCTKCPTGCIVTVLPDGRVEGATCPRGEEFARAEVAHPERVFTGTVRVAGASAPLVAVRTAAPVPRGRLFDVARACRRLVVAAPVTSGQVLVRDVAGTGVALVATGDADAVSADG